MVDLVKNGRFFLHAVMRFLLESGTGPMPSLVRVAWVVTVVELEKRVAGRQRGCIDRYLLRLVVYHFRQPADDDEDRIVTGALSDDINGIQNKGPFALSEIENSDEYSDVGDKEELNENSDELNAIEDGVTSINLHH